MPTRPTQLVPGGVNLFGYFRAESGVGEHARTMLAALDEAGIPVAPIDFAQTRSRRNHPLPVGTRVRPEFDVHLICVNADQTPHFFECFGAQISTGRRIGYWHWEVEEFPREMAASAQFVDEVWTASRHSAEAIGKRVEIPVHVVPPAVAPPMPCEPLSDLFPSAGGTRFLTCFDFDSVIERKNPEGAIEAFRLAFPNGGASLLVKSVNGHLHQERFAALAASVADRQDIRILDRYLSRSEQASLIATSDVFVSLHRAEGFGLMIAEAMLLGRPVLATGYSGNVDFLDASVGILVPWRPAPIPASAGPYSGQWADPDLASAAAALRILASNSDARRALGSAAATRIASDWGTRAAGERAARRLQGFLGSTALEPTANDEDLQALAKSILRGPDPSQRAVLGALGRGARRLALRIARHQSLHHREIELNLLEFLRKERRERLLQEWRLSNELACTVALAEARMRRDSGSPR